MDFIDSSSRSKEGFSIIEILVVLSIISILIGVTLNRFTGQTSQKIHQADVESAINFLTLARAKANSGESDICRLTTESLYRIEVRLRDSNSLEYKHICYPTFSPIDLGGLSTPTPITGQMSVISTVSRFDVSSAIDVSSATIASFTRKGTTITNAKLQVTTSDRTPYNTCIQVCDTGSIVQRPVLCAAMPANVCN